MSIAVAGETQFGMGTIVSNVGMIMDVASTPPPSLSVLCADVSGSARLHEKLGDAEALRAVDRCVKRMERAIDGFGGRVLKSVGGEVMAAFDSVDEAYQAAVDMQQRVADIPPVSGVKLAIRVGFSYGPLNEQGDSLEGESVNAAVYLVGLALPGQVLTNLTAHEGLSSGFRDATRNVTATLTNGRPLGMEVFEVVSSETATPAEKLADASEQSCAPISLRYRDKVIVLDENNPLVRLGRGAECDVLVHDRRASRHHAQIERRGDRVFLVDNSTNGTFVTLNGKPELFLRGEECVLYGKGTICFAASASSKGADCAEFEQL